MRVFHCHAGPHFRHPTGHPISQTAAVPDRLLPIAQGFHVWVGSARRVFEVRTADLQAAPAAAGRAASWSTCTSPTC
jgi:hypothetical protein